MKNKIHIAILIISTICFFGISHNLKAENVTASYSLSIGENIIWVDPAPNARYTRPVHSNVYFDLPSKNLDGYMNVNLTKNINLVRANGNLLNSSFELNKTESVNLIENNTFGNYRLVVNAGAASNGQVRTLPLRPLDDSLYQGGGPEYFSNVSRLVLNLWTKVSAPVDNVNGVKLESANQDIVECVNTRCTAKGTGSTSIKVSFIKKEGNQKGFFGRLPPPLGYGNITARLEDCFGCGLIISDMSQANLEYSFPSITYTVTVPQTVNLEQITTCTPVTNITKNSATVNWSYTDVDNDPQTNYQVQIATDSAFTNIVDSITAPANTDVSTVRSVVVTGLNANTTYYSRVRTYNTVNGWSVYTNCAGSFKTTFDTTSELCNCNNRNWVCNDNGTQSKPPVINSPLCAFNAICDIPTVSSGNTNFRIILDKPLGNIKYERVGGSPVTLSNTQSYTHSTTTITTGSQSITVKVTDEYDQQNVTKTCTYTTDVIPPTIQTIPIIPTVKLTKSPSVTMSKNGICTLSWDIKDMPTDATCTLTGKGGISLINGISIGSYSETLQQNKRFTLTCSGPSITTISKTTICRINPEINEI